MTLVLPTPSLLPPAAPRIGGTRLWYALTRPGVRRQPARGFDVFGEFTTGWWQRRSAKRLDWVRAKAIVASARAMTNASDATLDGEIRHARHDAVMQRDDVRVIDHAFAVGYEVVRREIGISYHPEQVLGALALATGNCAELATGEGKTVTAILPAALDAWSGRGVHVITVNDYLARRDAGITRPAYRRLGLSVGEIQDSQGPDDRRAAYAADITYAADKQVIFDHLRDRLVSPLVPRLTGLLLDELSGSAAEWGGRVVQRGLYAAIVDEADSVLIDDAVTPAIISAPVDAGEAAGGAYRTAALLAQRFTAGMDYAVAGQERRVRLTGAGRRRLDDLADQLPAFWRGPRRREELLSQALTARDIFRRGEDYVVREGKIEIIDRSTGRVLPGRQWQLGLHQAVEAKEGLALSLETVTAARTSYQAFFQRYRRLSGMTGTAREVASELWAWYRLPVVRVPTHRRVARRRLPDRVFETASGKFAAAADRVAEANAAGRPVLVGTWSVNDSEHMAALLQARGVTCRVLNATRESEEADIISRAGEVGAVTVATNMAGRGTDIVLNEQTRRLGGLMVIATERHDEPRVDRQLAGRAGRQGDPGSVECFVAFDDRLLRHAWPPLVAFARRARGAWTGRATALVWWAAQRAASRRWAGFRAETTRSEAWLESSMHQVTR